MLKRTPFLGLLFGCIIALTIGVIFEEDPRPLTRLQWTLLLVASFPPGLGFAMFLDPYSKRKKQEYLAVDFYEEGP